MTTTATPPEVQAVQKAAAPIAFIAITIGACLAVVALIRRLGPTLPLPDRLVEFVGADDDDDEDQGDAPDVPDTVREGW